ncbi:MAG: hypothetical protein N2321_04935 [Melioribacteraceae bacterium]|nr:hypothetical protein [Melioribacteraceae bacterium]
MNINIGNFRTELEILSSHFENEKIAERIWQKDFTVWSDQPDEITNRLGWLNSPSNTLKQLDEIFEFVKSVINEGFKNVLLLGMGGSSLAPEVFRKTFGIKEGYLDLAVLDSTDPEQVKYFEDKFPIDNTLFIVSTKSGGTVETFSFLKYFYNKTLNKVGLEKVGNHFVAITDPGSGLETTARQLNFRKIFLNDPNIGGRYSALSLFGIVPAALIGVDIKNVLKLAEAYSYSTKNNNCNINEAAKLGLAIGLLAKNNIDKLTFIYSKQFEHFGAWVEQLIAESTGKNGKGILPIVNEEILTPENYLNDRFLIFTNYKNETNINGNIKLLKESKIPFIEFELEDLIQIGVEFFKWEFATIVASWVIKIQPFDQPNVESAKIVARKMVQDFKETGKLTELPISCEENGIKITSNLNGETIKQQFENLISLIEEKKKSFPLPYLSIQAYINMNDENEKALQSFRTKLQTKINIATTLGFGPRFLHSTGQLHKGDAGNGFFIQIINEPEIDLNIPDEAINQVSSISFGILIKSQALGDRQALIDNNRNVMTINLGKNYLNNLQQLISIF